METDDDWIQLQQKLFKKVLQPGKKGRRPHFWSEIEVHCSDTNLDSSDGSPINLRVGSADNHMHRVLETVAQLMDEDEISLIRTSENSNDWVVRKIHLVKITRHSKNLHEWSSFEMQEVGQQLKDAGIQLYKNNRVSDAFFLFSSSFKVLLPLEVRLGKPSIREEEQVNEDPLKKQIEHVVSALYSNLVACHLSLQNYEAAVQLSNQILERDRTNVKALYRKASALMGLGDYEGSHNVSKLGLELEPTNKALEQILKTTAAKCRVQDEPIVRGMKKFFQ